MFTVAVRMVRNCNKFAMAENTKEQTCNFLCSVCSNVPCGNTVTAFNCDHVFLMWLSTSEHKKMVIVVSSQARTEETILKIPFCLHCKLFCCLYPEATTNCFPVCHLCLFAVYVQYTYIGIHAQTCTC